MLGADVEPAWREEHEAARTRRELLVAQQSRKTEHQVTASRVAAQDDAIRLDPVLLDQRRVDGQRIELCSLSKGKSTRS